MNYTYKLTSQPKTIYRIEDKTWIPVQDANGDYQRYLEWLAEGNTPLPADPE